MLPGLEPVSGCLRLVIVLLGLVLGKGYYLGEEISEQRVGWDGEGTRECE
jgi:hypothetical protein